MSEQPTINFTPELLAKLKTEYDAAVRAGQDSFIFDGKHELVTRFAKYLIEYLDQKFGTKPNEHRN